jgi:hypothetical protein
MCYMCTIWAKVYDIIVYITCAHSFTPAAPCHRRSGSYMCYVGSMATTRKDESVGYRPDCLHLGKFPTRYSSPMWRQDELIVVFWDEPNVRRSWLKAELGQGRLKLTRYINNTCILSNCILFNCFFICRSIWTLFKIPKKKITLLFVVFSLLSCRTHNFFPQSF